ncbi:response regulator [Azospirillum halopraeferens]|uniref:response regulator n=1 Tax=Azospirillum halopraeferens TaxID=34010 RepID=UPI000408DFFD|nr:response regulator [Azospirillum halopraeferens]
MADEGKGTVPAREGAAAIRVMLVEDEPGDARLVEYVLRQARSGAFLVEHTDHLGAAIAHLSMERADVVLLDLSLPDSHGVATVKRMKAAFPSLPVIVLTGLDDTDVAVAAVEAGAQDFLVKGQADGPLMQRAIRYAISRQRLEDDLRAAKSTAEAASRAKSDFLATISHEIRTPMNGVLGTLELLSDGLLDPGQRELAGIARQSAEGLLRLLDDILDFSRMEAGKLSVEAIVCDPCAIAASVVRALAPHAGDKGLALTLDTDPTVPRAVVTDPSRLRQILFNLVGNAVKFTAAGGVTVRARSGPPLPDGRMRLEFEVEDTGIGIPAAALPTLFERFTQADGSITRRYGGTGLGLAICKQLCEMLGGAITVDSTPGRGSRFRFHIVCTPADAAAADAADGITDGASPHLPPLCVLAVDDNAINRDIIRRLLERDGHTVLTAADGDEAVRMAGAVDVDLVLMDLQMPEMDGLTATRLIRALPGGRGRVPVIALTAHASPNARPDCRAAGLDGFVTKPVRHGVLLAEMARVLAPCGDPPPPTPAPVCGPAPAEGDLLDADQVAAVAEVFGPDWPATVDAFGRAAREQLGLIRAGAAGGGGHAAAAHTLKGVCRNMGAGRMGDAACVMERAPAAAVPDMADAVERHLEATLAALREWST